MRTTAIRTVTTVVIGAGHAGLAMSRCLADRSIDHVRAWSAARSPNLAHRTLGFAAAADAQLAEPAAGFRLQRRRSRRLPDGARGHRFHRELCEGDLRSGADPHDGDIGAQHRDGIPGAHGPGRLAMPAVVLASGACNIARVPAFANLVPPSIATYGPAVSQSRPARRRRRPGGGRIRERHADRLRNPAFGPSGDLVGGRAHSGAPRLSRQGPASGGWMPPACSTSAMTRLTTLRGRGGCLVAARRDARSINARPQCADRIGVKLVGRARRHHRSRQGAVCRIAAQHVCAFRSQDGEAAGPDRRMGAKNGFDDAVEPPHRLPPTRVEDSRRSAWISPRRDQDDHLGHRLPPRLLLARSACSRSQGQARSTTEGSFLRRDVYLWGLVHAPSKIRPDRWCWRRRPRPQRPFKVLSR